MTKIDRIPSDKNRGEQRVASNNLKTLDRSSLPYEPYEEVCNVHDTDNITLFRKYSYTGTGQRLPREEIVKPD